MAEVERSGKILNVFPKQDWGKFLMVSMWGMSKRENLQIIEIILVCTNGKIKCPFAEVRKTMGETGFRRKSKFCFGHVKFEVHISYKGKR